MSSINIKIPEFLRDFIDQQVAQGKYSSRNDYILALIHQEQAKNIPSVGEEEDLYQSAKLYAEVYEEDQDLKELTDFASADFVE
ncbi:MAG: hypothetical protein GVY04_05770 [Cyanobacteria bacterium]|jgi:Arc/MetJ-type ribon-helix-helix transcriptional regulator|nr:hypothetical protein [Cyanobacteria bacterium GSL.Bin1]